MLNGINTFGPTTNYARFGSLVYPTVTPVTKTLTTAGGVIAGTAAEFLGGLLRVDCDDAQTLTTPTAAALVAAIEGCQVGTAFDVDVINYGDTTLTIGLGAGVTKLTIHTVAAVLTLATLTAKRFKFVCTNNVIGSEAFEIYAFGSTAAAVA
jgi:hypothetical protein